MEITAKRAPEAASERQEVSVLMLGREQSGKTSLLLSLEALRSGVYPKRFEHKAGAEPPPVPEAAPPRVIPPRDAGGLPLVILDTPPCGARDSVRLPGGRRLPVALRTASLHHDAVLFVLDGLDVPLWEDPARTEELAALAATLRRQQYSVVVAVTKLLKARENALREAAHGADHRGQIGRDPRSCYEEFVSRYLEKTAVTLQAAPPLRSATAAQGEGGLAWPRPGATILDVPTWSSLRDYAAWQDRRGTQELPNLRYIRQQLEKLVSALSVIPEVKPGHPWHQLVDDEDDGTVAGA